MAARSAIRPLTASGDIDGSSCKTTVAPAGSAARTANVAHSRSSSARARVRAGIAGYFKRNYPADDTAPCEELGRRRRHCRLWITPPPGRASPIREGIIKRPAAGTPNPVGRDPRPRIRTPPAGPTIRPPMRRNRSAVPLERVAGHLVPAARPTIGCRRPARAIAIPWLGDARRWTRGGWPDLRSRRSSLRCRRGGQSKHSRQRQSENAHSRSPAGVHAQAITDQR